MEEPLKIAVCEDSCQDKERLLSILQSASIANIPTVFDSGEALLQQYRPFEYDLLLTDIYMAGITGVETVRRIREIDTEIPIAFVTSSPDHALEGYRLSVLMYIEKPYTPKDIENALALARMNRDSSPALLLSKGGKKQRIPFSQILYLEQQTHHVRIVKRTGQEITACEKLSALLPQLEDQDFYSPHKSYCVNMDQVRAIDTEFRCFRMADNSNVPIRRESMHEARKMLEQHLFQAARGKDA